MLFANRWRILSWHTLLSSQILLHMETYSKLFLIDIKLKWKQLYLKTRRPLQHLWKFCGGRDVSTNIEDTRADNWVPSSSKLHTPLHLHIDADKLHMYIHSRWNNWLNYQKFLEEEMEFPLTLGGNDGEALVSSNGLNSPEIHIY